jgi:ribosomal protein L40E
MTPDGREKHIIDGIVYHLLMEQTIECPNCGTENAPGSKNCRMCGQHLAHSYKIVNGAYVCTSCGARNPEGADLCNSCRTPLRHIITSNLPEGSTEQECVHWSDKPTSSGRAAKVMMAGILVLIAGVLGVAQAVLALSPDLGEGFVEAYEDLVPGASATGEVLDEFVLLQIGVFLFGAIAIFGSMFALNQSRFDMSLVGGVFGVLAIGFLFGAFLSLVGLILIVTSKKQFLAECA